MSWESETAADSGDVLLPLDLEDLAAQLPRQVSDGQRAAWLLRKASVYRRLAFTLGPAGHEALAESSAAEAAGKALLTEIYQRLQPRLRLPEEDIPQSHIVPATALSGEEVA